MNNRKKGTLNTKTTIVILFITLLMMAVSILISYSVYAETMDDHYKMLVEKIGRTTAKMVDGDKIEQYLATKEKDEEYDVILNTLFDLKESNDCKFLYIEDLDPEQGVVHYVMDADTPDNAYQLGDTALINEVFFDIVYSGEYKNGVASEINYTKNNGWLCSGYQPILNSKGEYVALVGVDISMNEIMQDRARFLVTLACVLGAITLLSIALAYYLIRKSIIAPLLSLTAATTAFIRDKDEEEKGISKIAQLNIKTNDEIEMLAGSVKQMEQDINQYIENLKKVTAEKERIGAELNVARSIQASMLPCIFPPFPERKEFDIYASMNPAKEVGGDFYDFFLVDETHLAMVMADVSGKGVPAALFMVIAKTLIKNYAQLIKEPEAVFTKTNQQLCENNDEGMFVTAFMGILDLETGMLSFVNAGHNAPLIRRAGGDFEWLKMRRGFVLAGMETTVFKTEQIQLAKDDILFAYTDGVTEAMNVKYELFSDQRLLETINCTKGMAVEEMLCYVKTEVVNFVNGAEQADDITMLGFRLNQ